jgi:hypothetical protein
MADVVTTGGSLECGHKGKPRLASTAKLVAGGAKVIPFTSLSSFSPYTGCTFTSNSVQGPCTVTTVVAKGQASKLTVGSQPVLLADLSATAGSPPPPSTVTVTAGQSKLTAV